MLLYNTNIKVQKFKAAGSFPETSLAQDAINRAKNKAYNRRKRDTNLEYEDSPEEQLTSVPATVPQLSKAQLAIINSRKKAMGNNVNKTSKPVQTTKENSKAGPSINFPTFLINSLRLGAKKIGIPGFFGDEEVTPQQKSYADYIIAPSTHKNTTRRLVEDAQNKRVLKNVINDTATDYEKIQYKSMVNTGRIKPVTKDNAPVIQVTPAVRNTKVTGKSTVEKPKDSPPIPNNNTKGRRYAIAQLAQEKRIKSIQRSLGVKDDGIWGNKTQAAYLGMKKMQRSLGVKDDGIKGKETIAAIKRREEEKKEWYTKEIPVDENGQSSIESILPPKGNEKYPNNIYRLGGLLY